MKTLVRSLNLSGNPFEHYTAETEPHIAQYAVRPPYLQAISDRVGTLSSFILFGDRGAGKSATRITVFSEIWNSTSIEAKNGRKPFVVNLTDYSSVQEAFRRDRLEDRHLIAAGAFATIEHMLAWLASLEEADRHIFIEGLDKDERTLVLALVQGFYLSVPEEDRAVSTSDTLKLLNSAWTTKSAVWASERWDALSKLIAGTLQALSRKQLDGSIDISGPAEELLKSLTADTPNAPRAILSKLVDFSRAFGYSGISILVDKVDETPATSNSAEATARLIHPLLTHVQLLEVPGFSWVLFLWSNVKDVFSEKYPIRLDKIAHATITWNASSLREMIDTRIRYFSSGKLSFPDLLAGELDAEQVFSELISIAVSSPRELIKLLDTIVREHDARGDQVPDVLDRTSLDIGQDKYCVETINAWFAAKPLQQVLRLGKASFVNRDVQTAFKIGDQGARVKIKNWQDVGLVGQSGTAPSEMGGKPVYRFVVSDARVERIIVKKLLPVVGAEFEEQESETD